MIQNSVSVQIDRVNSKVDHLGEAVNPALVDSALKTHALFTNATEGDRGTVGNLTVKNNANLEGSVKIIGNLKVEGTITAAEFSGILGKQKEVLLSSGSNLIYSKEDIGSARLVHLHVVVGGLSGGVDQRYVLEFSFEGDSPQEFKHMKHSVLAPTGFNSGNLRMNAEGVHLTVMMTKDMEGKATAYIRSVNLG